jgi:hypothetical protein
MPLPAICSYLKRCGKRYLSSYTGQCNCLILLAILNTLPSDFHRFLQTLKSHHHKYFDFKTDWLNTKGTLCSSSLDQRDHPCRVSRLKDKRQDKTPVALLGQI